MKSLPKRYWIAIFAMHLFALMVSWGVGLWLWFSADALVFGYLVAFVAPVGFAIFVSSFVTDPTKTSGALVDEQTEVPLARRISMSLIPFFLAAIVMAPAIHLGWSSPSVRAAGVRLAATLGWLEPAENGLLGISPQVRLSSCRVGSESELPAQRIWASISSSPSPDVTRCLVEILPPGSGHAEAVRELTRTWSRRLRSRPSTPEVACEMAHWIAKTDSLGNDGAAASLLDCALDAPALETQVCCAQSLRALTRGAPVYSVLPGARTFAESSNPKRLEMWASLSRQGALDPRVDEFLDWSGAENREALYSLTCDLVDTHEPAPEVLIRELTRVKGCKHLEFDREVIREACAGEPDDIDSICGRAANLVHERVRASARASVSLATRLADVSIRGMAVPGESRPGTGGQTREPDLTRLMLEVMQREHGKPVDFDSLELFELMKRQQIPE